jgi:hypothetical protein
MQQLFEERRILASVRGDIGLRIHIHGGERAGNLECGNVERGDVGGGVVRTGIIDGRIVYGSGLE